MTTAAAPILSGIQREAFAWQRKNFGEPNALVMLCGITEEYGEACEWMHDTPKFLDGVADAAIYLAQFCSICEWSLGELWDQRELFELPSRPWPILMGKINHHHVKGRVSHYRGTTAEHDVRCRAAIAALLRHWDTHLRSIGHDFVACVERTWAEVSQRDWRPERQVPASQQVDVAALAEVRRLARGIVDAGERAKRSLQAGNGCAMDEAAVRVGDAAREALDVLDATILAETTLAPERNPMNELFGLMKDEPYPGDTERPPAFSPVLGDCDEVLNGKVGT